MLIWPATRFVAGTRVADVLAVARASNADGLRATLDLLGENVTNRAAADAACDLYVRLLHGIADAGIDSNISIKLTMLGLDIDEGLARDHLVSILEAARDTGNWVRIDMEGSRYTQATLDLFYEAFAEFENVGTVIQTMLRRSVDDIDRLNAAGARVRLVKGAYSESAEIAFSDKQRVNENFDRLAERLLVDGKSPAIATHDDARIDNVIAFARERSIPRESFEFQMLYGIRSKTQRDLVRRGYGMRVYIPYGEQWLPYFSRRLRERKENVTFLLRNLLKR